MKQLFRRCSRKFIASTAQLCSLLCRPLFFFCFLLSLTPGILLASLLGWKAMFFPAAMPHLPWILFLPVWLILSCGIPSLSASVVLAMPSYLTGRCLTVLVPVCTMHLLLAFSWSLFLLYHLPPLFCMLAALVSAVSGLLAYRHASRLGAPIGGLMLIFSLWNSCLVLLSFGF